MSLLLDALNRASKDKADASAAAKAAAGGEKAVPPVKPTPTGVQPAPDWPTIGLELTATPGPAITPAPANKSSIESPPTIDDGLRLVAEPEKVAAPRPNESVAPTATVTQTNTLNASVISSANTVPKPVPKVEPVVAEPKRALPPSDAPRVAQNILRAKAPAVGTGLPKRLILLGSTAVLLATGLGSVMLGLWGDPMTWLQTSNIQASSVAPSVKPTETVIEQSLPEPAVAVVAAAASEPAPVQSAPLVVKTSPAIAKVKTPPQGEATASRSEEIVTECGAGMAGPGCTPPKSLPTAASPPRKVTPTLLQTRSAGPSALETGYAALIKGKLQEASQAYNQALSSNPEERDALLGLAYIAHQQDREDDARAYYKRVLRQDPGNPIARSGLLTLSTLADANELGSRASELAEQNPDSAAAQSALGHGLVRQGRLADAQLAFQRAQALEPTVALHAFNLAVALDRLRNYGPALTYYERALTLSSQSGGERTSGVPHAVVQSRIEQLRSAMESKQ